MHVLNLGTARQVRNGARHPEHGIHAPHVVVRLDDLPRRLVRKRAFV
jgi:hypothetical protein